MRSPAPLLAATAGLALASARHPQDGTRADVASARIRIGRGGQPPGRRRRRAELLGRGEEGHLPRQDEQEGRLRARGPALRLVQDLLHEGGLPEVRDRHLALARRAVGHVQQQPRAQPAVRGHQAQEGRRRAVDRRPCRRPEGRRSAGWRAQRGDGRGDRDGRGGGRARGRLCAGRRGDQDEPVGRPPRPRSRRCWRRSRTSPSSTSTSATSTGRRRTTRPPRRSSAR